MKQYNFLQEARLPVDWYRNVELVYKKAIANGQDGKKVLLKALEETKGDLEADLASYLKNKNSFTWSAVKSDRGIISAIENFLKGLG